LIELEAAEAGWSQFQRDRHGTSFLDEAMNVIADGPESSTRTTPYEMVVSYSHPTNKIWLIVVFKERTDVAGSEHGGPIGVGVPAFDFVRAAVSSGSDLVWRQARAAKGRSEKGGGP
jgi:hypothetical protein